MERHIAIPVKNLEDSEKFYKENFGFYGFEKWERLEMNLMGLWAKDDSGFVLEFIYHPDNKKINFSGIIPHIGFQVKDLKAKMKELEEKVEVIKPISKGISVKRIAFIKDPNGLAIEFYER